MEVKLDKRYPVAATLEQAWAVLSDIRATAACMPGAQITEQLDDTHYKGTVRSKVGPAVMTFSGDIELQGMDPAARQLKMLGKGADKSGSSASMQLTAHLEPGEGGQGCVLAGQATISVSGKLAQFGSRLLVPVSDAMLAQFADNFRAVAAAVPLAAPGQAMAAGESGSCAGVAVVQPGAEPPAPSPGLQAPVPTSTAIVAAGSGQALAAAAVSPGARPVKELNALSLLWAVIKGWLARLFGRRA